LILDMSLTDALHLFALAAAILALGCVYWLVRDQDSRERTSQLLRQSRSAPAGANPKPPIDPQ
jgi:uncharacterized membrane protein (DUF373 family)